MKRKLNLGCGKDIKKEFVNLDIIKLKGVDVVHDLNKFPYPFKNNEFSYVLIDNVLEHVDDIVKAMEEIHRISEDNAIIEIIVPWFSSTAAFQDPTHRHFFTLKTFDYFTDDFDYNFYINVRFKILKKELIFSKKLKLFSIFFNKYQKLYELFFIPYLIPAYYIRVKLKVIKNV